MAMNSKNQAAISNSALEPLRVLVGQWSTVGAHPYFPEITFHGRTTFEWMEGGAFVIMHSEIDEPGIPSGVAVLGSDDLTGQYFMLYFDERGVSRKYEMSLQGEVWSWWRHAPGFSQRFTGTITDDGRTIVGIGEMSKNDASWEKDLALTYTRVDQPPAP